MSSRAFVGRRDELGRLEALALRAREGNGGLVCVTGEPGIGKTRLAAEAASAARDDGMQVVQAVCWDGVAPAYWPWTQVMRALQSAGTPLDDAGRLVEPQTASGADVEIERFALFDAALRALTAASAAQSMLLVLDDVQWADGASLELLRFVGAHLATMRVAVVACARDGAAIALRASEPTIALRPLSGDEVAELAAHVRGTRLDAGAAADLHARSRGNPLFAAELAALGSDELPDSIRSLVRSRVSALGASSRALLERAAVLGASFRVDVLAACAGVAADDVVAALSAPARARIVSASGPARYGFVHDLVRDALYAGLGDGDRARLHLDAAVALQRLHDAGAGVDPSELAHHFGLAATAGAADRAVQWAVAAMRRAAGVLAHEDAARHGAAALAMLELAPGAADATEVLLDTADARLASGDVAGARSAFLRAAADARASGRAAHLARAALGLGGGTAGFEVALFDREQVALLHEALAAPAVDAATRAHLLARLSVAQSMDAPLAERAATAERAVDEARSSGDSRALAAALAAHCDAIADASDAPRRTGHAELIVQLSEASGDARMELLGLRLLVEALLERGDLAAVDEQIARYERAAQAVRMPLFEWYAPLWRGMRACMDGDHDAAQRHARRAEEVGEAAASANASLLVGVQRSFLLLDTGRGGAARDLVVRAIGDMGYAGPSAEITLALVEARAGDPGAARARLRRLGLPAVAAYPRDSERLPMLAQLGTVSVLTELDDVAAWTYDELLVYRSCFAVEGIGAWCHGSVERFCGQLAAHLGRPSAAHFAAALDANAAAGFLVELTRRDAGGDVAAKAVPAAEFRWSGASWELRFGGSSATVRDSKGMHDLARLLATPGRPVSALDLAGRSASDLGEVVDAQARESYRRRVAELDEEIADADAAGDPVRSERASAERDGIVAQLSSALGLGGRARRAGDESERARSAVTWRVRDAVRRIAAAHAELGRHLERSVKTGAWCVYDPEQPVAWRT